MSLKQKLPVGIQSFEKLRLENYVYVDKTKFIWELSDMGSPTFLSRPRRFGKSLLISTMKAYFEGKEELFRNLAIHELESRKENPWQSYPVLHIDLNKERYVKTEDLENTLDTMLCVWEREYGKDETERSLSVRFNGIIKRACEKTGQKVVVLVDEYDKPLLSSILEDSDLKKDYRSILKSFYGILKSADQYLKFVFLTGVTKFSKISIFSDLNNLRDISNIEDYSDICGITQEEMEAYFNSEIMELGNKYSISYDEAIEKLRKKYNGYRFSEDGKAVYNPFSIFNTFVSRKFKKYWFATGTPSFLIEYLRSSNTYIPKLDGEIELPEHLLDSYRVEHGNPIPVMFQSGYLTIKGYNERFETYRLGFPNDEVRYAFLDLLMPEYTNLSDVESSDFILQFISDIESGKVEDFMQRVKSIIAGISYDNLDEEKLKLREQNYQTAVYLIFKLMGQFTQTEIHSSKGRSDCIVQTDDHVYIFEFKLSGKGTSDDAINQIIEKGYAEQYKSSSKKITAIGSAFDEDERTLKDWVVKEIK